MGPNPWREGRGGGGGEPWEPGGPNPWGGGGEGVGTLNPGSYMHICAHICIYALIYAYMRAYMHIWEHIRISARIYAYMHICAHICAHICIYAACSSFSTIYIYIYIYIYLFFSIVLPSKGKVAFHAALLSNHGSFSADILLYAQACGAKAGCLHNLAVDVGVSRSKARAF